MKKTLSVIILTLLMLSVGMAQGAKHASGGKARQLALGGSPQNPYLMDYSDVLTNPAWAVTYNDILYAELGYSFSGYSAYGQSAGFSTSIIDGLTVGLNIGNQEGPLFDINSYGKNCFGVVWTYSDYYLGNMNAYLGGMSYSTISELDIHPLQVYAALKLSGLTVGVGLYRSSKSFSEEARVGTDTVNTKRTATVGQTGVKAGILLDADVMLVDVSVLFRGNSGELKRVPPVTTNSETFDYGGSEFGANARVFMKMSNKFTLVPMARFYSYGYKPEIKITAPAGQTNVKQPTDMGRSEIEFGIGANINVAGGKIFTGASFQSLSIKNHVTRFIGGSTFMPIGSPTETQKQEITATSLPKINIGAEFDVASWLTGRLGYYKAFTSVKQTVDFFTSFRYPQYVKEQTMDVTFQPHLTGVAADQLLSVGLSLHFDRLSFDGYLCEQWLADGPYITGGVANSMFAIISMSYNFN